MNDYIVHWLEGNERGCSLYYAAASIIAERMFMADYPHRSILSIERSDLW